MTPARMLSPALAGLLLAVTLAPAQAAARPKFDGNWSVLIMTKSGPCDPGYRYGLSIRNGRVFYDGSLGVNVNGSVSNRGAVRVRLSAGSQAASGEGRLSRDYGSGRWRGTGSSGTCTGVWTAERR